MALALAPVLLTALAADPVADPAVPAPAAGVASAAASASGPGKDGDAPTVTARIDRTEAHVGDVVTLTIVAIARKGVPVNLPAQPNLGALTVLDRRESERDLGDGRMRREFTLDVAAYQTGDLEIPPIDVTYLGPTGAVQTVRTPQVPLRIGSLIANELDAGLRDDAAPVAVVEAVVWPAYAAGGVAAAALGALGALAIHRRIRRRVEARPAPPPRPAHEVALEKLDRLGATGFADDADHRPFTFAVSEVMREYFGARYGFDSLEMTTDELVDALRPHAGRGLGLGETQGWLSRCDLVKFAKQMPSAAEARGLLESAVRMVEATRARSEPAPQPGEAPRAA